MSALAAEPPATPFWRRELRGLVSVTRLQEPAMVPGKREQWGWATCSMPVNLPRASHAHLRRSCCRTLGRPLCRQSQCRTCRISRIPQKTGTSTCAKGQRLTAGRDRRAGARAYFRMLRAGVDVANSQLPPAKQAWLASSSCIYVREVNHWFLCKSSSCCAKGQNPQRR
jgi:hypothetical protein